MTSKDYDIPPGYELRVRRPLNGKTSSHTITRNLAPGDKMTVTVTEGPVVPPPATFPATGKRPFADASPWNTPIPVGAAVHPQSAALISAIELVSIDTTQFTYPVYALTGSEPVFAVKASGRATIYDGTTATDAPSKTLNVRLPLDVVAAAGSDGQIIVIDGAGNEWDLWQVKNINQTAHTATCSNGSEYRKALYGPGTTSPTVYWSRGAGVPYFAGLIRPWEITAGKIEHALAMACNSSSPDFVYPATKSDGQKVGGIPEGSRIQLDPSVSLDSIRSKNGQPLTAAGKIIAKALQDYGVYVIDVAGNTGKIIAEYDATARWTLASGIGPAAGNSAVNRIPSSLLRVLA